MIKPLPIAALLFWLCCNASAQLPQPFSATYEANYNGIKIKATRSLSQRDDGRLELRFQAKSWLAKIEEFSHFNWRADGQLVPHRYEYHRSGLGRDRHAVLDFDWQAQQVTNNVQKKPWTMALPETALDKLSYQLQLRHDLLNQKQQFSYAIADGGRLKQYRFELLGQETLDTPLGKLDAIKIKRIRKDNKRVTFLWMATDWDYLVVRLRQQEKDGKHYEINLARAELNGRTVQGY